MNEPDGSRLTETGSIEDVVGPAWTSPILPRSMLRAAALTGQLSYDRCPTQVQSDSEVIVTIIGF